MTSVIDEFRNLIVARQNPLSFKHSMRMAATVVVSYLVAELFRLPEAYWAAVTTLIVMQSATTALPISAQYFAGTAVGALAGGWAGTRFPGNAFVFGLCVLGIGVALVPVRVERGAFRYAATTLAIVMLVRSRSGWTVAMHRFLEVSIGIAVGLAISRIWPEAAEE